MQYLKHVVEDDVLFTKVILKFKPVTLPTTGMGSGSESGSGPESASVNVSTFLHLCAINTISYRIILRLLRRVSAPGSLS